MGAIVLAAAGTVFVVAALVYRVGGLPNLGRHRGSTGLWKWQQNIVFAFLPYGAALLCAGLVAQTIDRPETWANTVAGVAAIVAVLLVATGFVFTYVVPEWLKPPDEREDGGPD
ncbi:MAG: hypothetical protein QOJ49_565 [Actinomycetota bacterium]|jgi:hypothetical protein|nr:hypothetical protein [Actinomycetota bacterium]MDQ1625067.1 hypothetical protein [Actinomycetota bacterium]